MTSDSFGPWQVATKGSSTALRRAALYQLDCVLQRCMELKDGRLHPHTRSVQACCDCPFPFAAARVWPDGARNHVDGRAQSGQSNGPACGHAARGRARGQVLIAEPFFSSRLYSSHHLLPSSLSMPTPTIVTLFELSHRCPGARGRAKQRIVSCLSSPTSYPQPRHQTRKDETTVYIVERRTLFTGQSTLRQRIPLAVPFPDVVLKVRLPQSSSPLLSPSEAPLRH